MYVGRFVVIAPGWGGYRVSSRSFPNRKIIDRTEALTVVQTRDAPPTDNPYISYNCLRVHDTTAVIGNGSHVDPIAEKLDRGYPARDALAIGLLAMDYERDEYDTPRIAGVIEPDGGSIGIVRRDALIIEAVSEPMLVATYERDRPEPIDFDADGAVEVASGLFHLDFDHPVCSCSVWADGDTLETAIENGSD